MPAEASISKADATIGYGASVHLEGESLDDCVLLARGARPGDRPSFRPSLRRQGDRGGPRNARARAGPRVDDLAMVIVPLGGGGLASGVACAIDALGSARRGRRCAGGRLRALPGVARRPACPRRSRGGPTLADGIAVKRPTGITVDLIRRHVDEIVAVGENEIADAIVMLLMRSKLVVEGAGAVGAAALMDGRVTPPAAGTTVVVLSGGNIDTGLLSPVIRRHETNAGQASGALRPDLRPAGQTSPACSPASGSAAATS